MKTIQQGLHDLKVQGLAGLMRGLFLLITGSSRNVKVLGEQHITHLIADQQAFLGCYWHQQTVFCTWYLLSMRKHGLKVSFLISPSKDGEIVARAFAGDGVETIRGSSSRTGAQALRNIYLAVKQGLSIVTPPDGPRGPAYDFKQGWITLASMTGAPLLPIAYAVDWYWEWKSWDKFWLPMPFCRCVIAVGEPRFVVKKINDSELIELQGLMAEQLNQLQKTAQEAL